MPLLIQMLTFEYFWYIDMIMMIYDYIITISYSWAGFWFLIMQLLFLLKALFPSIPIFPKWTICRTLFVGKKNTMISWSFQLMSWFFPRFPEDMKFPVDFSWFSPETYWSFQWIFHEFPWNLLKFPPDFSWFFPEIYQHCITAKVVAEKVSQGRTLVVREVRGFLVRGGDEGLVGEKMG